MGNMMTVFPRGVGVQHSCNQEFVEGVSLGVPALVDNGRGRGDPKAPGERGWRSTLSTTGLEVQVHHVDSLGGWNDVISMEPDRWKSLVVGV